VWSLGKLALDRKQKTGRFDLFDLVYLDGAHTLMCDAAACAILKLLLKPNGYILFDDMNWTFSRSKYWNPKNNPQISTQYT
jgi:hypothetical protein